MNGNNSRLTPDDFLQLAQTIEMPRARALVLMADCARRLVDAMPDLALPPPFAAAGQRMRQRIVQIAAEPFV